MEQQKHKKKKKGLRILALVLVLALAGGGVWFYFYTSDYYRAEPGAFTLAEGIGMTETKAYIALEPDDASDAVGYIFYPGGLVEAEAYLPYLQEVAQGGYLCAVVQVPLHLAILKQNAADSVREAYPHIQTWAVGGHSLGGVVAASYANKNEDAVEGLVLLAAYPTADLSDSRLLVTSITATDDKVLNWDSWEKAKAKLPGDTVYLSIGGGNHSGFGRYGHQSGDGTAGIPPKEQQSRCAAATGEVLALLAA